MSRIILASASPRRRELLNQIGLNFEIIPSSKEEVMKGAEPAQTVMGLAETKAGDIYEQIADQHEDESLIIIGADTVVVKDGIILGKPKDEADALKMLRFLQGGTHQVYTGVCLIVPDKTQVFYEKTDVTMYSVSDDVLEDYIRSGEPADKAGGYAIQGIGTVFIREIQGDYNNVVGLPVAEIWQRLMRDETSRKIVKENRMGMFG